jgi:hypothetical protein
MTSQRPFFDSELNLKISDVMKEKHKAIRKNKPSNTKESYFVTGEENRSCNLK